MLFHHEALMTKSTFIFTQKNELAPCTIVHLVVCMCVCVCESERESESVQKEAWHVLNYLCRPSSEPH